MTSGVSPQGTETKESAEMNELWTHRIEGGPWPERIGCRCRIVSGPPFHNVYPWSGLGAKEVVVLIDNDPLSNKREWSCVIERADLAEGVS